MKGHKNVEQNHSIVTDEDKLQSDASQENKEAAAETSNQGATQEETQNNITPTEEEKWFSVFTLTGAASFLSAGILFVKDVPKPVYDEKFAARLRKTGFFKEGE